MGEVQPKAVSARPVKHFVAVPLFTSEDEQAFEYFQKYKDSLQATTGAVIAGAILILVFILMAKRRRI